MLVYLFPLAAALGITNDPNNFYEGSFPSIANMLSFGTWLGYTLIAGALFSNMGVYLVYIHTSSNALCSLAEKGDAPNIFGWKLFRFNTPWFAVFFYSITTQFWTTFDFSLIVEVETVLYCIHVIILISTFFKLRYSFPDMERPFRIRGPIVLLLICSLVPIAIAVANIAITGWFENVLAILLMGIVITSYFIKMYYEVYKSFGMY